MIFKLINKILTVVGLTLTMTGCMGVGDDLSGCAWDENATLTFHYTSDTGQDLFPQNIGSVDAFVFDDQNCLVAYKRFDQAALGEFRGWKLTLSAGDYRAVCWANVESNSCFSALTPGTTTLDQCFVEIDQAPPATGNKTGDKVFYSPYKSHPASRAAGTRDSDNGDMADYSFTITPGQTVVKQMHFIRAHRTLNVYVQGFSDGGLLPVIEVSNLWGQYDFRFNTLGRKCSFTQDSHAVTTDDGPAALASFHHAFGDVLDNMVITLLKASDNSEVCKVNLKEFIDQNPSALKEDIDVLIKFGDMGMTVSIPGWLDRPITPGI